MGLRGKEGEGIGIGTPTLDPHIWHTTQQQSALISRTGEGGEKGKEEGEKYVEKDE